MERTPVSSRLKEAMKVRGIKQSKLAEKTGISKSMISEYVKGKYEPKQDNIYKIAKALNVKEAWLMGFEGVAMNKYDSDIEARFGDSAIADDMLKDYASMIASATVRDEMEDLYFQVLSALDFINEDGFEKVIDYIHDLSQNPNYGYNTKEEIIQHRKEFPETLKRFEELKKEGMSLDEIFHELMKDKE